MRFGITGHFRSTLARGAAVVVLGGLAAGCGAGASSLTDGLVTNSTTSSRPVTVAQANQPYPGDMQGRRAQPSYERVIRPKAPVGGGAVQSTAPAQLPAPSQAGTNQSAPVNGGSAVSSSPLPAPQRSAATPSTGTQPANTANRTASPSSGTAPQPQAPANQPDGQLGVLPQAPKPQQAGRDNSGGGTANDSSDSGRYTVASGDTLYGISRKTGVSVDSIKQANGLSGGMIRVGQTLTIPQGNGAGQTTVAKAEPAKADAPKADPVTTASADKAGTPPKAEEKKVSTYTPPSGDTVSEKSGEEAEEVAALTPDATGVGRLRWPARGRVVAGFGSGSSDGIDIAVPEGTSVRAAENGVVIYSGDGLKGFGNTVLVRHEDGLVTVYGHASQLKVKRGDNVKRGQEIALSGMSGEADRPKLHFEVRKGTSPVDPMTYLE
ncbi:peptidoglycan DD-metalloendopeptidase family protein [Chelativorans sp. M5D2P16]|uniref:peptidoglycan DD-metalloendopeptidase family protein n=1 Tax=Chelativorans sp. M5D2P16 TaxID=3095678 RepID=UPI002ACADB0B|nr:peptidoglycan DD-metalloendopeptidase family protein [Chelativorans sp. M5D2P16]MDZ5697026.1 peptidoglycan DD-metalloendopeptidase family protein [Chelativorans sp. M5D2P16]